MSSNTFYFSNTQSPATQLLQHALLAAHWSRASTSKSADFTNQQLTLDEHYTQHLEYKHHLAQLCSQYCPEIMPLSYTIDEGLAPRVVSQIQTQFSHQHEPMRWILKPALMNNGEGIVLFNRLDELRAYYQQNQRWGGPHVLQQYIDPPHLLQGHKYSIRLLVIISNHSGAYLYKEGYFNISRHPYQPELNQPGHLTNEHLGQDEGENIWQIPSNQCPNFSGQYALMRQHSEKICQAFWQQFPNFSQTQPAAFGLFGFDFMLDENCQPWLLEINHGPCFPIDPNHPLQSHLYNDFWPAVVTHCVQPIAANKPQEFCQHPDFFPLIKPSFD